VNNSTAPLELEDFCQMTVVSAVNVTSTTTYSAGSGSATTTYITFGNGSTSTVVSTPNSAATASTATVTLTEYLNINGTMGGQATAGIPANSQVTASCTMPTAQLGHETEGSIAEGGLHVKLVDSADSYPAGTVAGFSFEGTWSHYNVTFQQVGVGACPFLGEPWAVTIGNTTKVQPTGTALPLNDEGPIQGTNNTNISTISFTLPSGSYQYQIHPSSEFFTPSSGILNVNATSNTVVKIEYTGHGCISTSTK